MSDLDTLEEIADQNGACARTKSAGSKRGRIAGKFTLRGKNLRAALAADRRRKKPAVTLPAVRADVP